MTVHYQRLMDIRRCRVIMTAKLLFFIISWHCCGVSVISCISVGLCQEIIISQFTVAITRWKMRWLLNATLSWYVKNYRFFRVHSSSDWCFFYKADYHDYLLTENISIILWWQIRITSWSVEIRNAVVIHIPCVYSYHVEGSRPSLSCMNDSISKSINQ